MLVLFDEHIVAELTSLCVPRLELNSSGMILKAFGELERLKALLSSDSYIVFHIPIALAVFIPSTLAVMLPDFAQRLLGLLDLPRRSLTPEFKSRVDRSRCAGTLISRPCYSSHCAGTRAADDDLGAWHALCGPSGDVLEKGLADAKPVDLKVRLNLSIIITEWMAECISNEADAKKRAALVKFLDQDSGRALHCAERPQHVSLGVGCIKPPAAEQHSSLVVMHKLTDYPATTARTTLG
ncbi:hypothetical protein EV121DRAFT_298052 [Schizophyllum commune]